MKKLTFITGNQVKADYLAKWLDWPVDHHKLDLDELQSLDAREVAEHKVRQAYGVLKTPVLVEDTALVFAEMGRLPGTFVKFFLQEIGNEGLCKLADSFSDRVAFATVTYGYFDGQELRFFTGRVDGVIAAEPRGEHGHGWDPIFIPEGSAKTFGEMLDSEKKLFSARAKATKKIHNFLAKN